MKNKRMTPPEIPQSPPEIPREVEVTHKNIKFKWLDKVLLIIGAIVLLCILSTINKPSVKVVEETKKTFNLVTTNLICEYGDSLSLEDLENLFEDDESIPGDLSVDFDSDDVEEVYPVGTYDIELSAEGYESTKIHLMIEDTTAPSIVGDSITIEQGSTEDLKSLFEVEDYSDFTVEIDQDDLDINTPGDYQITVKATDEYYNQTVKECSVTVLQNDNTSSQSESTGGITGNDSTIALASIPEYSGEAYIEINNNVPEFEEYEIDEATTSYETYSSLDSLGRCGTAEASVSLDTMPTEDRKSISSVKPSGWNNERYDIVPGGWVYNRCHLIGFQLTGENANKQNLITGTRYMNVEGMLPFENQVAEYVRSSGAHVLYEVTPIYEESNDLVASGVHMQACSVEDDCQSLAFNVYAYNVQPGIEIDYSTGANWEN